MSIKCIEELEQELEYQKRLNKALMDVFLEFLKLILEREQ